MELIYDYCPECREERHLVYGGEMDDVAYTYFYICYVCQAKIWIDKDEAHMREVID